MSLWGLSERFDICHGDILPFSGDMVESFDLITLSNILYYFVIEDRIKLLEKIRTLLSPTGMVAVAMSFHSKGKDVGSANLNMVNSSLGGLTPLPDLAEITSLLKQCGFGKSDCHRFMPGSTFFGIVAGIT